MLLDGNAAFAALKNKDFGKLELAPRLLRKEA